MNKPRQGHTRKQNWVWRGVAASNAVCIETMHLHRLEQLSGVVLSIGTHRLHRWNRSHRLPSTAWQGCSKPCLLFFFLLLLRTWLHHGRFVGSLLAIIEFTETKVLFKSMDATGGSTHILWCIERMNRSMHPRCTEYARCTCFPMVCHSHHSTYVTFGQAQPLKQENLVLGMSWMRFV